MHETTRRSLVGPTVSGVKTLLWFGAALYVRQRAVGDYQSMILPPSLLVLELAAVMVVVRVGNLALPTIGSQRHLYYLAAALGLIIALAWAFGWGIGSPWGFPSAFGKAI